MIPRENFDKITRLQGTHLAQTWNKQESIQTFFSDWWCSAYITTLNRFSLFFFAFLNLEQSSGRDDSKLSMGRLIMLGWKRSQWMPAAGGTRAKTAKKSANKSAYFGLLGCFSQSTKCAGVQHEKKYVIVRFRFFQT